MSRKKKSKKSVRKPQNQETDKSTYLELAAKKAQDMGICHWT